MDPSAERGDHRQFEDMAVAHVLGGLDETAGRLFRSHLVDCPACRARVGELRSIAHELAGVEQAERRVRAAKTVEMKSREQEADGRPAPPVISRRALWARRLTVFGGALLVLVLAGYVFSLRSHVANLEVALDQRADASAALEFGEPLRIDYAAPGASASAKLHEGHLVVLVEGVADDGVHGMYLLHGEGADARTLRRQPLRAESGRLLFLVELRGDEERLVVTQPADTRLSVDPEADGSLKVVEATLPAP